MNDKLSIFAEKGLLVHNPDEYRNLDSELRVSCGKKHEFTTTTKKVRQKGFICPECEKDLYRQNLKSNMSVKEGHRILAIDQGSREMGLALYEDDTLIAWRYAKFSKSLPSTERLYQIAGFIAELVAEWKPDSVTLEEIQYQSNIDTYKRLAKLQGIIEVALFGLGIPSDRLMAATWRSMHKISGTREQVKSAAIKRVKLYHNLDVNDDVAEAILMGQYAVSQYLKKNRKDVF